jgi:hypothetical protein
MMLSAIREAVMRTQARAYEIPLDRVDLQVLARSLMLGRSPPEKGNETNVRPEGGKE